MAAARNPITFQREVLESLPTAPCDVTLAELAEDMLGRTDRASCMRVWHALRRIRAALGESAVEESRRPDGIMARRVLAYRLSHEAYVVVMASSRKWFGSRAPSN